MARVKANSYGDGTVYLGGNKFKNPDGSIREVTGYFVSPSGKRTYTDADTGDIIVLGSANIREVGTIYNNDAVKYQPTEIMTEQEIREEAERLAGGKLAEKFYADAVRNLGGANKAV